MEKLIRFDDHTDFHIRTPGRCSKCRVHHELCFCDRLPGLDLKSRLVLIMHRFETFRSTASAPIAALCLKNHEFHVHGYKDHIVDLNHLYDDPSRRTMILFPEEGAKVLTKELLAEDPRPVNLIVPDGNWRQAKRMAKRIPGAEKAEIVVLAEGKETEWGLRTETKEGGLATFEAISRAFGVLESKEVEESLDEIFRTMVNAHKKMQGGYFEAKKKAIENQKKNSK